MARDNFTARQIQESLEQNALFTASKWRDGLTGAGPHYECEVCHFVSNQRSHFEVDHIHPCASGGTRNLWTDEQLNQVAMGNIAMIHQLGINCMVLCYGCNQAKKAKQFVPPGAGWAYRFHHLDLNPDHLFNGAPKVSDLEREQHPEMYDPKRYQ